MMKVIKVIVDELPKNCSRCKLKYTRMRGEAKICFNANKYCFGNDTRPNWCPLVTVDEIPIARGYTLEYSGEKESEE